ncbi:DUF4178 domain-containing protein [Stenomitos frigidus]|nr:DUF4178 domain-containing protein [Stenomitos frigidus]
MSTFTEAQLRQLRTNDRLKYHGVEWRVNDYSTYTDDNGYETEEWLLKSLTGKEYYLLREIDPANPDGPVHWFLAETVRNPALYEPESARDLTMTLAADMRSHREPYPTLRMYNRTYEFESQTQGNYESDGESRIRTTWDYWDAPYLWNLALEAWPNNKLVVYSTREVQPEDFTDVQQGAVVQQGVGFASSFNTSVTSTGISADRAKEYVIAWGMVIVGFLLMMFGI